MTTCSTMRAAVILASGLLLSGVVSLALAEFTGLAVPLTQVSLWLVLAAAATLGAAFTIAVWPGNGARLAECLH